MQCYIIIHSHGNRTDKWVRFTADNAPPPSREQEILALGSAWLPSEWIGGIDCGDHLEIVGPFPVPTED